MAKAKVVPGKLKVVDGPKLLKGLGTTQVEILQCIAALQDDDAAYGLKITEELVRRKQEFVNPAQVFVALKRLVTRELIEQHKDKFDGERSPKRLYRLTKLGTATLVAWRTRAEAELNR